jgi:hypothetical protein
MKGRLCEVQFGICRRIERKKKFKERKMKADPVAEDEDEDRVRFNVRCKQFST